jgi:hypothetical protein
MSEKRICLFCKKEFETKTNRQKYCSRNCKESNHKKCKSIKDKEKGLPPKGVQLSGKRKILREVKRREMCVFCGRENALNIHERDLNRANIKVDNLVYLCAGCHFILHNYVLVK